MPPTTFYGNQKQPLIVTRSSLFKATLLVLFHRPPLQKYITPTTKTQGNNKNQLNHQKQKPFPQSAFSCWETSSRFVFFSRWRLSHLVKHFAHQIIKECIISPPCIGIKSEQKTLKCHPGFAICSPQTSLKKIWISMVFKLLGDVWNIRFFLGKWWLQTIHQNSKAISLPPSWWKPLRQRLLEERPCVGWWKWCVYLDSQKGIPYKTHGNLRYPPKATPQHEIRP